MAITNGYTTIAVLKTLIGITQTTHDADLERAVESASREVDRYCSRRFYVDTNDDTRTYTAEHPKWLRVADIDVDAITTVKTDDNDDGTYENTWTLDSRTATYSYRGLPENANTEQPTAPVTTLEAINGGWPVGVQGGVEVVGNFGWAAVPVEVTQATLLLATRIYKRKDSPYGVLGTPEAGVLTLPRTDPDLAGLLGHLRRYD